MLKLGLTGGIGSGKSTVAKIFESLGIPVFYADDEAKKFLIDIRIKNKLRAIFGSNIFDSNNNVNKAALAQIVFSDSSQLQLLNTLIHPLLLREFANWAKIKEKQNYPYVVIEAAILFEAHFNKDVDKTLSIIADTEDRIKRVIKRDSVNREQVLARINNQWSDKQRAKKSDFVIDNSNNKMILASIIDLHNRFNK